MSDKEKIILEWNERVVKQWPNGVMKTAYKYTNFIQIEYGAMARTECIDVPENIHPHMFRHARDIHLYRSGMPLALLSEYLFENRF